MNESSVLPIAQVNTISTSAPNGYVLTSNGTGSSSFAPPPVPVSTFGRVGLSGLFNPVTIDTNRGIITTTNITADTTTLVPALFTVNNSNVTKDSVIMLTIEFSSYMSGASVNASVVQVENGLFSILLSVVKGALIAIPVKIHFVVL
jgi:hypothetical protein